MTDKPSNSYCWYCNFNNHYTDFNNKLCEKCRILHDLFKNMNKKEQFLYTLRMFNEISSLKKEIEELKNALHPAQWGMFEKYKILQQQLKAEQEKNEKLNKLCPKCKQELYCIASVGCFCWMLETGKITREEYNSLISNARNKQ